jgi:hypothetical protein
VLVHNVSDAHRLLLGGIFCKIKSKQVTPRGSARGPALLGNRDRLDLGEWIMPIERGRYRFAVNETPRGTLCITAYLVGDTIPSLDGALQPTYGEGAATGLCSALAERSPATKSKLKHQDTLEKAAAGITRVARPILAGQPQAKSAPRAVERTSAKLQRI